MELCDGGGEFRKLCYVRPDGLNRPCPNPASATSHDGTCSRNVPHLDQLVSGGVPRSSAHGVRLVGAFNFPPGCPEFSLPKFRGVVTNEFAEVSVAEG